MAKIIVEVLKFGAPIIHQARFDATAKCPAHLGRRSGAGPNIRTEGEGIGGFHAANCKATGRIEQKRMIARRPTEAPAQRSQPVESLVLIVRPGSAHAQIGGGESTIGIRSLEIRILNVGFDTSYPRIGGDLIIITNLAAANEAVQFIAVADIIEWRRNGWVKIKCVALRAPTVASVQTGLPSRPAWGHRHDWRFVDRRLNRHVSRLRRRDSAERDQRQRCHHQLFHIAPMPHSGLIRTPSVTARADYIKSALPGVAR